MYSVLSHPGLADLSGILVASCNLLEHFGTTLDPVDLTKYLEECGGIGAVSQDIPTRYDGNIGIVAQGGSELPPTQNAIVLFRYQSPGMPDVAELYCAVDRLQGNAVVIVDSYNGATRTITEYEPLYGRHVAWWAYGTVNPPLPTPTHQPEQLIYVTNTVDGITYKRLNPAPQKMYVTKPGGTYLTDFSGKVENHRDFINIPNSFKNYGEAVRIMGEAHHPVVPTGQDFYVTLDDWGNFTRIGHVEHLQGYSVADLSPTPPKPLLKPELVPVAVKPNPSKPPKLTPEDLGFAWFNPQHTAVRYQVMRSVKIYDYIGNGQPQVLYKPKIISAYGSFRVRGRVMLLLRVESADIFDYWYGAPEVDQDGNRILEQVPDYAEIRATVPTKEEKQALHTYGFSDYVVNWVSQLELYVKHDIFKVKRKNRGTKI
jgi:hypothetical protein